MPHWVAMLAIVVAGWLSLAVLGGFLIGRGLRAFERLNRSEGAERERVGAARPPDARRAA